MLINSVLWVALEAVDGFVSATDGNVERVIGDRDG